MNQTLLIANSPRVEFFVLDLPPVASAAGRLFRMSSSAAPTPDDASRRHAPEPSAGAKEKSQLRQVPTVLTALATLASLVAALVAVLHPLRTNLIKGFALAGFVALIATLSRLLSSQKKRRLTRESLIDLASIGILCICVTAVLVSLVSPRKTATLSVEVPPSASPRNPLPTVPCRQQVSGTGSIPRGYELVIGYGRPNYNFWTFWPWVTWRGDQWSSTIHIGFRGNVRTTYELAFEVIPSDLARSLLDTFNQGQNAKHRSHFWDSTKRPPLAIFTYQEDVSRSGVETDC